MSALKRHNIDETLRGYTYHPGAAYAQPRMSTQLPPMQTEDQRRHQVEPRRLAVLPEYHDAVAGSQYQDREDPMYGFPSSRGHYPKPQPGDQDYT